MSWILPYLLSLIVIVLFFVLGSVALSIWETRALRRRVDQAFVGRAELDEQAFYDEYFSGNDIPFFVVQGVREILADELNVNLSRLSAEDDFGKNLSFFDDYDSLVLVEIVMRLEEEFQITIEDSEAENAQTVRDIVYLVSSNLSATQTG
ncbi:MAG TPA: acyl carrier protein [Aridibacter sp.]|nr:acyl carrier protein [Aridibacter sp.]